MCFRSREFPFLVDFSFFFFSSSSLESKVQEHQEDELICQVFDFDTGVPTFASKDFAKLVTDGIFFMDSENFQRIKAPEANCFAFPEDVSAKTFSFSNLYVYFFFFSVFLLVSLLICFGADRRLVPFFD